MSIPDPWNNLRRFTDARIGLGRSGSAMPTREVLAFSLAHAEARDAVTTVLDWEEIDRGIRALGFETVLVESGAADRGTYLRRPDLGRRLSPRSREELSKRAAGPVPDIVIMVGDGLSSKAVAANIVPFLSALLPHFKRQGLKIGPVVLAHNARVALGDDVAEMLGARAVAVLIGERPGLSSPDSLGVYLTWAPRVGLKDADRNCISNVRVRGLSYEDAAFKLAWLTSEAFKRQLTGVNLKDESDLAIEGRTAKLID